MIYGLITEKEPQDMIDFKRRAVRCVTVSGDWNWATREEASVMKGGSARVR